MRLPLASHIEMHRATHSPLLSLYLTAGYPTTAATLPLLKLLDQNGADLIELGMPFSDPIADGQTIQHCSHVALNNGVSVSSVLTMAAEAAPRLNAALILMGYFNPILKFGVEQFIAQASAAGIKGLIIPDLLPEDSIELRKQALTAGLSLIYLVSPNTSDERIKMIDEFTTSFIYAVSVTGVTGARSELAAQASHFLQRLRAQVKHPVLVGFGVSSGAEAARLAQHADGVIVGSALLNCITSAWEKKNHEQTIAVFVSELRNGLGGR